jgi:hypothetical protein
MMRRSGKLMFAERLDYLDCIIRNMSEGGATVRLKRPCALPDEILLREDATHSAYVCKVRWQRGRLVGLSFVCG